MNDDLVRVELPDIARTELAQRAELVLPAVIVDAGPAAVERFLEFFAARIANARTRAAYGRAVGQFLAWCAARGLGLTAVSPLHVAAYIRTHPGSAPTVKQHLAAIRMLGDWLVVSQVIPVNPAAAVRGPKHVVTTGATPVLSPAEARRLLAAIDTGTLAGLRDRALVSVMLYSFARVSAVIGMRRQDYFRQERQGWLRLHEKGGTRHDVPAHHRAAAALDDYLARAGLDAATAALFQSVDPAGRRLTGRALSRRLVLAMIKRRAAAADLPPSTCCHTFRATGITVYLSNGGTLEHAQRIAGHASPKTTKLYDRTADTITVDEIQHLGERACLHHVLPETGRQLALQQLLQQLDGEVPPAHAAHLLQEVLGQDRHVRLLQSGRGEDVQPAVRGHGPRDDLPHGVVQLLVGPRVGAGALRQRHPDVLEQRHVVADADRLGMRHCQRERLRQLPHRLQAARLAVLLRENVLQRPPAATGAARPASHSSTRTGRTRGTDRSRPRTSPASPGPPAPCPAPFPPGRRSRCTWRAPASARGRGRGSRRRVRPACRGTLG